MTDSALKEKRRLQARKWRSENPEAAKEIAHRNYKRNKDKILKRIAKDRKENLERYRAKETKSYYKRKEERPEVHMYRKLRDRVRKTGLDFDLIQEDIIIPSHCPVLGLPLVMAKGKHRDNSPSIDRIDNSKGYVRGNIIIVSWRVNRIKCDATIEELSIIADFYGRLKNE